MDPRCGAGRHVSTSGNNTRQAARLGRYQSNPKYAFKIYIYIIHYILYILYIIYIIYYIYYIYILYCIYIYIHIICAMVPVGFIIFIQSIPSLTFRNVFQRPLPSKRDDDLDLHAVSQGGSPMADWFISWKIPSINGYPIGSMYAIDGNIYHQYTPVMLAYIYIYIPYMDPMGYDIIWS